MNEPVYVGLKEMGIFAVGVASAIIAFYKFFVPRDTCDQHHAGCLRTQADLTALTHKVADEREDFIKVKTLLDTVRDEMRTISSKLDKLIEREN